MWINKVVISATNFGQLVQNRIYVRSEEFQEVDEIAAHIWNSWINTIRVMQHSGLLYFSVEVSRNREGTSQKFTELRSVTGAQSQETQGVSFSAAVLQFQTGLAGRKFHGRYYVAAHRQGTTHLGMIDPSEMTIWRTQLDILQNAYCGADGGSTGLGLVIHGEGQAHDTPVTSIGCRPILGVQRRRNIGVGA